MVVMRTIRWTLPAIGLATAPLRVAATGTRMALNAAAGAAAVAGGAALVDGSAVSGIRQRIDGVTTDLGTITRAAAGVAIEALGGEPLRRASSHGDRRWIRDPRPRRAGCGPDCRRRAERRPRDAGCAPRCSESVRSPGLWSRWPTDGPSTSEIGKVVAEAERGGLATGDPAASTNLPGDDAVLVARTAAAAVAAAGFGLGADRERASAPRPARHASRCRRRWSTIPRSCAAQIEQRLGPDGDRPAVRHR